MKIPFTKPWREARAALAKETADAAAKLAAERTEGAKDTVRRAEARFKPLGAVFTEWGEIHSSTPVEPRLRSYFHLPASGILYRVEAEHDGYTVHRQ